MKKALAWASLATASLFGIGTASAAPYADARIGQQKFTGQSGTVEGNLYGGQIGYDFETEGSSGLKMSIGARLGGDKSNANGKPSTFDCPSPTCTPDPADGPYHSEMGYTADWDAFGLATVKASFGPVSGFVGYGYKFLKMGETYSGAYKNHPAWNYDQTNTSIVGGPLTAYGVEVSYGDFHLGVSHEETKLNSQSYSYSKGKSVVPYSERSTVVTLGATLSF